MSNKLGGGLALILGLVVVLVLATTGVAPWAAAIPTPGVQQPAWAGLHLLLQRLRPLPQR